MSTLSRSSTGTSETADSTGRQDPPKEVQRRDLVSAFAGLLGVGAAASMMSGCVAKAESPDEETLGQAWQASSSSTIVWYSTVSNMRTGSISGLSLGQVAVLEGYNAAGDGGGGVFFLDSSGTDDYGTVFAVTGGGGYCWKRIYSGTLDVRWFGAKGDGSADCSTAIGYALAVSESSTNGARRIHFPTGSYLITSTITISGNGTHLTGDGMYATVITFNPSSCSTTQPLFKFSKGTSVLYNCSIRDMAIGSTDESCTKIALQLLDVSDLVIENIVVGPWATTSPGVSIGLQISGRELVLVHNYEAVADLPLSIEPNPNDEHADEDCDHCHLFDLYLIPRSDQPCFFIDDGVTVSNLTIDGENAFVGGTYGLYWKNTTTTIASFNMALKNVRREQTSSTSPGEAVYLWNSANVYNVTLENIFTDVFAPGIQVHGPIFNVTLQNCVFPQLSSTPKALTLSSCYNVEWRNCFFQEGSAVDISGMIQAFASPRTISDAGGPPTAIYVNSATAQSLSAGPINGVRSQGGTAAPTSGTWSQGDIVWNTAVVTGQPNGWRCVSGGSPGTWVAMANL